MATVDIWPTVQAEREALAADLADLGEEGWSTGRSTSPTRTPPTG